MPVTASSSQVAVMQTLIKPTKILSVGSERCFLRLIEIIQDEYVLVQWGFKFKSA